MTEHRPSDELLQARARHMDSLNRLRTASPQWSGTDRRRGENTMANLTQQIHEIDEVLSRRTAYKEQHA